MELLTVLDASTRIIIGMKFQFCAYILPVILTFSCADSSTKINQNQNKIENKDPAKNKPAGSFSDTVQINSLPSAVFYDPDSLQLEKIKAITNSTIFESTMHEYFYQMRNSRIVLKKYYPYIKIIEVKNARYLLFEKAGGEKEYVDLNTKNDPSGIFIFDGQKAPQLVDMTNIESELGFYFSKSNSLSVHIKEP